MSRLSDHHRVLTNGIGKCSVPMWSMGHPAGFCDETAYGEQTKEGARWKYPHYVPGLACPSHGGPTLAEVAHHGDPCVKCGVAHDDVSPGPCTGTGG